jgi:isochorismate synthase
VSVLARATGIGEGLREALHSSGRRQGVREDEAPPGGGHRPRLVFATSPVEAIDPLDLYAEAAATGHETALLLSPSEGFALVGIGRAWATEPSGSDRFRDAEMAWRALLEGATRVDPEAPRGTGPILLGGLGFSGDVPAPDGRWAPFGPASMVLPALSLAMTPAGSWLTAALVDPTGDEAALELEQRWERLDRAVRRPLGPMADERRPGALEDRTASSPPPVLSVTAEQPDAATWDRLVSLFAGAVGRGRLDKVVLARRVDLCSPVELDVPAALRRLAGSAPESTVYAFARGGRTFLGATPERLVRTDGREFRTAAVAGTTGRGRDAGEDARLAAMLLATEKELEEHAVVVDALREALRPLADRLEVAPLPAVLQLRHVQHLVTPIEGTLHERGGLLALAGRLHPTPAVGGEPRDLALALIEEHEGFERGWYAGPVGWLGADGDGELWVALRCGIVDGPRATLFAGCGIVADSGPEREWQESRIKLRAVATALGRLEDDA